jgi:hypothetical protein
MALDISPITAVGIPGYQSEVVIGFSFRKSINMGPVRLNLSKSGLGVSTGVKGLRVSVGPRGTYLNAGAKGVYYRKKLNPKRLKPKAALRLAPLWILLFFGIAIAGLFVSVVIAAIAALLSSL